MKFNYIEHFFNKEPEKLTLSDLKEYFSSPQIESSTLEFKSGEIDVNDIFKEIAAFLNTEGGLLIIGAPRESKIQEGKHLIKVCHGEVTFSNTIRSKEWLSQKIFSNITPSPTEIFIKQISDKEGNIFILDIPQSFNPPHQSNADGKYYIRIDTEAKPAPHGLVQALFDKRRKPEISARLDLKQTNVNVDSIGISLHNNSVIPADKVNFIIDIYNIESVLGVLNFEKLRDPALGLKFTCSGKSDQILARIISIGFNFDVRHLKKKYIIAVVYWSKETDTDCTYFSIDPIERSVEPNNWFAQGAQLVDRVSELYQ